MNKVSLHAKFHTYTILCFSEIEIVENGLLKMVLLASPKRFRYFREKGLSPVSPRTSWDLRELKPLLVLKR